MIPLAMLAEVAPPVALVTRTGMIGDSPATPAMPSALLVSAAAAPATSVPWPYWSAVLLVLAKVFQPATSLPAKSGCVASTPLSRMAITAPGAPCVRSQAWGARIWGRCHWLAYCASLGNSAGSNS